MKRMLDLVAAALGLVLAAPVIGVLVLMIRRDSPGPGLFRQVRVGRDGRPFVCLKLRTMTADTPSVPTHDVGAAQITPLGRRLRAAKLDELPQLWNVLVGDMSLVGPRPCLPTQTSLIAERQARGVFALRPGITGLAQIQDIDMSDPVRLAEVDARYAAQRSLRLDLWILLRTVLGGAGRGDRVRT